MTVRKYLSENNLVLCSKSCAMLTPEQLHSSKKIPDDLLEIIDDLHIYVIAKRPALSFDPQSFKFEHEVATGEFTYKIQGKAHNLKFWLHIPLVEGATKVVVSPYPHKSLLTQNNDGKTIREFPALWVSNLTKKSFEKPLHYEVLYVGQAFAEGKRHAFDRLKSHSTLQRILADLASSQPDDEVMLFMFEYDDPRVITSMEANKDAQIKDRADIEHLLDILTNPIDEKTKICLAEAALIKYFMPPYNEIYKDSFPKEDLKLLEECYRLDFCALTVEINTEDLKSRLYSQTVSDGLHHIAKYDLHDTATRRSFFTMLDKNGKILELPRQGGPVF